MILRIETVSIFLLSICSTISKPVVREILLTEGTEAQEVIEEHQRLFLKCSNDVDSTVQWFKEGKKISEAGDKRVKIVDKRLKIHNVKREDAGHYQCSLDGSPLRKNLTLTTIRNFEGKPPGALEILAHKQDADTDAMENEPETTHLKQSFTSISKLVGDTVKLSCQSLAPGLNTDVTRQWFKNENMIKELMTSSSTYVIESATLADSGNYTCAVSNKVNTLQHHIELKIFDDVEELPVIVEAPTNVTVKDMDTAIFTCRVSSTAVRAETPKWIKLEVNPNEFDLEQQIKANQTSEVLSAENDTNTLVLDNVSDEDVGWYLCYVKYGPGKIAHSSAWLSVILDDGSVASSSTPKEKSHKSEHHQNKNPGTYDPNRKRTEPNFTKTDQMHPLVMKPAGNMLKLLCAASGNPEPNITWTKDDKAIERHLGDVKYKKWAIVLEDLTTEDQGLYKCDVCNSEGCINFTFNVGIAERLHHRPILTEAPENKTVVVGSAHNFTCRVLSDSHPTVQWFRGQVTNNASNSASYSNLTKHTVEEGGDNSEVLELYNVTHEDEGWYTCIAGNSLGVTDASAYLHVVDELEDEMMTMVSTSQAPVITILVGVLCATFFLGVCIVLNVFRRLKREKLKKMLAIETAKAAIGAQWTKKIIIEKQMSSGKEEVLKMPIVKIEKLPLKMSSAKITSDSMSCMSQEYELPLDVNWEFPRSALSLGQTLGEGAFGKVIRAEANGIIKQGIITTVAVKMLKDGHSDAEMMDLVSEMEMMKMIGQHINIINLLGVCTQDGPLYVIVEFAPHDNLRDFLRKHRPSSGYESPLGSAYTNGNVLTEKDLISFAYQVANGMQYLQSRKCIHRDLAARNVLVSDNFVLKIADFGLARDVHCQDYYRKTTDGRLPVKWMAPEALFHRLYTHQSDVWSYGILLWEILTLGGTPYPSVPTVETLFQLLRSGHRMEKPPNCSKEVYEIMRDCWSYVASERPEFNQLVTRLDRILTVTTNEYLGQEYLELESPLLDTPPSSEDESNDDDETSAYLL
uniref:receptor protein-tyrosine kinase n=1 Tax=Cacopsylla melanoneura TaxID=428564 RepID=A0A8D8VDX5_9HEMI